MEKVLVIVKSIDIYHIEVEVDTDEDDWEDTATDTAYDIWESAIDRNLEDYFYDSDVEVGLA